MRIDLIYPYLVPLTFAAIWALTSLFNRENQPLPPRSGRVPGPNGGGGAGARPSPSSPTLRTADWRPEVSPSGRGSVTLTRSPSSGSPGFTVRQGVRKDEEILIIEAEPRRPSPSPTPSPRSGTPVSSQQRAARTRPTSPPASRKPEDREGRSYGDPLTRNSAPSDVHSEVLKPLILPPSPLLTTPNDEAEKAQALRAGVAERDSFSSADIRLISQTPGRLREGFIMAELLKPPVSLRPSKLARPRPRPRLEST